jgi:hypothetical protein
MTVGELKMLLRDYDDSAHVAIVWPHPQQGDEGPWLAEIEKVIAATHTVTGEVDVLLESIEIF